jgi:2-keto-3-deoxy-L-rhamnonate aldolase RhmA
VEVLAGSGLDFIVLDAEHAPFDRNQLDVCLMAARAGTYGRTPMLAHFEVRF